MNNKKFSNEIYKPGLTNLNITQLQKLSNESSNFNINKLNLKKKFILQ